LGDKHATIHTSALLEAVVRTELDGHAIAVISTAVIAIPEIGGIRVPLNPRPVTEFMVPLTLFVYVPSS
jgi:hypothetical protein